MPYDPEPEIRLSTQPQLLSHTGAWARLWAVAHPRTRPMLRSGAWYPVVGEDSQSEVLLAVRHRTVRLPAHLVELRRGERPRKFTVVVRSLVEENPASGTGRDLGARYAVCPASGHRIRLRGRPARTECPGCGYRGEIGWGETG